MPARSVKFTCTEEPAFPSPPHHPLSTPPGAQSRLRPAGPRPREAEAAGRAAAGGARPGRCRRVTPSPGVANRKRKSRRAGAFPLIRFTL